MFTRKRILLGLVLILLVVGGAVAYKQLSSTEKPSENVNKVNYGPPTEEEQSAGDKQKAANTAKDEAVNNSTPSSTVQLVLVDAGQYFENVEVRAYTSSVYESGGKCTATFTKGSETVKVSTTAFKDATTTQCGALDIARTKFPSAGQWQLVVSYSSASSSGATQPKTVTLK